MKQPVLRASDVRAELKKLTSPEKAKTFTWFFKTGPGEYGEGDQFIGITVPELRRTAKVFRELSIKETLVLLRSPIHEERLFALFLLIQRFAKSDSTTQQEIYHLYLANTQHINNWDLVDTSTYHIVGAWLSTQPKRVTRDTLLKLARSANLWERRIAMVATYHWIRLGEASVALLIAKELLSDRHDLIQKAVGWMLREVGKRCDRTLLQVFLEKHRLVMGRTALRYAIEHFSESERKIYLARA